MKRLKRILSFITVFVIALNLFSFDGAAVALELTENNRVYETSINESVEHIRAYYADDEFGYRGEGVTIAIIDTGVDFRHPHLRDNYVGGYNIGDNMHPRNNPMDFHGHGTHVAGVAAGESVYNGIRYQGVAPDANILAYNVAGRDGVIYGTSLVKAIERAVNDGADIINMSVATDIDEALIDYPVMRAIDLAVEHGVVVVVPVGNEGDKGRGSIRYPGNTSKGISVGSTGGRHRERDFDLISSFSSSGPSPFDLEISPHVVAPGGNIVSPKPGGGYAANSGTSLSAPHVAGAAALLIEKHGDNVTPEIIKSILMNTSEVLVDREGNKYPVMVQGAGRVDLERAMEASFVVLDGSHSFGFFESDIGGQGKASFEIIDLRDLSGQKLGDMELEVGVVGRIAKLDLKFDEKILIQEGNTKNFEVSLDIDADTEFIGEYCGFLTFSKAGEIKAQVPLVLYVESLERIVDEDKEYEELKEEEKIQDLIEIELEEPIEAESKSTAMVISIGSKIYTIDEKEYEFEDVIPFIRNDRTYLPVRAIMELFDADVIFDSEERSITVESEDNQVIFRLGEKTYTVNGGLREMDVAPYLDEKSERTYLPVRYFSQNLLGAEVNWDPVEEKVLIFY
ncbi:S8 family serine peptidase [Natranaerofaba carboxydovora]|uniref:S8 family serine peptidase n=1 Tax=Natranaerofaba carboxydovora TaxID=2742683 RepID=UPI001F13D97B|nr:S8 family serine peptidase [Natranaerofaba carboxydovora]UMZ74686.1 Serine protease AprX [Natranaerofaba carboxydovora]